MFETDGQKYRDRQEYDDFIRDKHIIDDLTSRYDVSTSEGIIGIYRELQTQTLRSVKGREFDDVIFEKYTKIKSGISFSNQNVNSSVKKADIKEKRVSTQKESVSEKNTTEIVDPKIRNAINKEIKKQNRQRGFLVAFLSLISICCLGYFSIYVYNARKADRAAREMNKLRDSSVVDFISVEPVLKKTYSEEVVIPEILDEYKAMYLKNKSLIGWIKIDDSRIDYPVMQTVDNEYYLKHNFNQEEDANGCIFLDCNCDVILGNTNLILYGHHMNSGTMFSSIVKYGNKDYYEKHKIIQFDTIYEKGTYEVMYAFRTHIYNTDEIVFKYYQFIDANSEAEFDSAMEAMSELSLYDTGVTASYGDRLLTLSTCDYQENNGRFAVVAKKID